MLPQAKVLPHPIPSPHLHPWCSGRAGLAQVWPEVAFPTPDPEHLGGRHPGAHSLSPFEKGITPDGVPNSPRKPLSSPPLASRMYLMSLAPSAAQRPTPGTALSSDPGEMGVSVSVNTNQGQQKFKVILWIISGPRCCC